MNFEGENQDEDFAGFMGEITFEDLLYDSQDERRESSIRSKLISKPEKKKRELAALRKMRDKKKNELTGAHWKGPLGRRKVVDKKKWTSNGCYTLENQPLSHPRQTFGFATLADDENLRYDCFMPTGQVYEFLPCAPWDAGQLIGYKTYRGMHRIMGMQGPPKAGHEDFVPYKLLLYRGWFNDHPEHDDMHRFVYLAENKPEEPAVGDCFVRLEEIHKRMNGNATDYNADCAGAILQRQVLYALHNGNNVQMDEAYEKCQELQQQGKWLLRFRCWAVEGFQSEKHELDLRNRLFENVFADNGILDHFEVFKVWAELLRKSQGDKLGAKDFFGRYWDAVIPNQDRLMFQDGFKIIVGAQYFQDRNFNYQNLVDRMAVRQEVFEGVQRAVNAPRLKFKPPLTINNVVFQDELGNYAIDPATGFDQVGWRYLDGHPGGLYTILVNLPVREFLCRDNHTKPFWQVGYGSPEEPLARGLQVRLTRCGQTQPTTTLINTGLLNTMVKKRNPTQDKCVADAGYSANLAMSNAYPAFYPNATIAKKRRVAEWLHRSAFSYGGYINNIANNSQNANNLVLGTPDTNTVMMRYEAFVKRLAIFSNNGQGTVTVETQINYPALMEPDGWMGDNQHRYTWLAADLHYRYYNNNNGTVPHVDMTRNLKPLNRETCLLFQSILDKSLEAKCWNWNCWDVNRAVMDALVESTGVDGDQEEANEEELKEELAKELQERDQEVQNQV